MFGVLSGIVAVPTIIGTMEAIQQGQRQTAREVHRSRKSHLMVTLPRKNSYSALFDGSCVVLKDNKLYVDTAAKNTLNGHPFAGYYRPHPEQQARWSSAGLKGEGFVSTISDVAPILNWIYVDANTLEVKYGNKAQTKGHILGPWDCTVDKRVTFEGWEGFLAVEETPDSGLWSLYFDRNNDALGGRKVRRLAVELTRKERLKTKEIFDQEMGERQERVAAREEK